MATLRAQADGPLGAAVGLVATVAIALGVALGGVTAPWWAHADPDGAYVGSALNLMRGEDTYYLDHPGLPTQVGLAVALGADHLLQRARGSGETASEYVDARLLDLDSIRLVFRTWAVLQYVGGAVLVFVALAWFLRHWTWGLAGALLYLATPGLAEISTLLRPDPALAALCVAVAVLTAAAFEARSAPLYLAAALVLGLAVSVKLTAVGLALPVAAAALLRRPAPGWWPDLWRRTQAVARRHRLWLVPAAALWLALAVVLNRGRFPFVETAGQRNVLLTGAAVVLGYLGYALAAERLRIPGASRIFVPFYGALLLAFAAGLAVPATLALDAGAQMPVSILDTLRGEGVNRGIDPFSEFRFENFQDFEQRGVVLVGVLALVAAAVGAWQRRWWPLLLAAGAAVLAVMAAARFGYDYYFAPAYAAAIPGALWALRARGASAAPLHAWAVVLLVFVPLRDHLPQWSDNPVNAGAERTAERLLRPGEVVLAPPPYLFSLEDTWWEYLVEGFVSPVPDYPYRFMDGVHFEHALEKGLRPRYAIGPAAELPAGDAPQEWALAGRSGFTVRRMPIAWGPDGGYGVVEIVELPEPQ